MGYIPGTEKGEILSGTREDDIIEGAGGDDELYGDAGFDHLTGGEGADHLDGGSGLDTAEYGDSSVGVAVDLSSGKGYFGTAAGDTFVDIEHVNGSRQDDLLIGNSEQNTLTGGGGNDTLKGMGGADTLDGGDGIDTASYDESPGRVFVSLSSGLNYENDAAGDQFTDIENLYGSAHNDILEGDDWANILWGVSGNDLLIGNGGNDTLWGGWGHDHLFGEEGEDTLQGDFGDDDLGGGADSDIMRGGPGNDEYMVEDAGDVVIETAGQGVDLVRADTSWTLTDGADVETLQVYGSGTTVAIDLTGNSSGNVVRGNAGNNILNGGGGNDELTGFGGQDSFLFDTALDAVFNLDVITDFNVADDTILLDQTIFSSSLGLGNISAGEFVIGAAALDANDRIIYDNTTGALFYDDDGVGGNTAIQFAELSAGLALTNLDFLVVA